MSHTDPALAVPVRALGKDSSIPCSSGPPGALLGLVTCCSDPRHTGPALAPAPPELSGSGCCRSSRGRALTLSRRRGGVMLVHDIRKNRSWVIDFREVAPLGIPLEGDLLQDTKVRTSIPQLLPPGLLSPALLPSTFRPRGRCPAK